MRNWFKKIICSILKKSLIQDKKMKHLKVKPPFVEFNSLKITLGALKEFNLQRQCNNYQNTKLKVSSLFEQKAISTPGGKKTTGRGFRKIFIDGLEHNKSTKSLLYFWECLFISWAHGGWATRLKRKFNSGTGRDDQKAGCRAQLSLI